MKLRFKLLDSSKTIQNKILQTLLPDVTSYLDATITKIKNQLPGIVFSEIEAAPEYQSLSGGILQYELGIPDPGNKLSGLINIWSNNIVYNYKQPSISNNKIIAKFSASMIRVDLSDVLYSDYAYVQDVVRGYSLPWLEWLLLYGNSVIVPNFQVVLGPNSNSRTGFAVMRNFGSGSWKVPSEFAGTMNDNWITRSIANASDKIYSMIEGALK
jgi:hypothetical protein